MAHEVVHLLHPNHGDGLWAVLSCLMPDWRTRKAHWNLGRCGVALQEMEMMQRFPVGGRVLYLPTILINSQVTPLLIGIWRGLSV
ncbi:YgjP-like metallopeptidase domain-containing protein [Nostoc commune]|uniref:YgjP-like metallopeptidase domain-containing protein n=1 Tax=Nostoc commune TaxID=1178 RepID=UPI0018C79F33|nr:M48 family metallopeptidase [Nostoc commune BAE]